MKCFTLRVCTAVEAEEYSGGGGGASRPCACSGGGRGGCWCVRAAAEVEAGHNCSGYGSGTESVQRRRRRRVTAAAEADQEVEHAARRRRRVVCSCVQRRRRRWVTAVDGAAAEAGLHASAKAGQRAASEADCMRQRRCLRERERGGVFERSWERKRRERKTCKKS